MSLRDAERTDLELREQLNDLVRTRARAVREAERLGVRAGLEGADPGLETLAGEYRGQAERLTSEVDRVRASLRRHEGELERLRAQDRATEPPAGGGAAGPGGAARPGGGEPAPGTGPGPSPQPPASPGAA